MKQLLFNSSVFACFVLASSITVSQQSTNLARERALATQRLSSSKPEKYDIHTDIQAIEPGYQETIEEIAEQDASQLLESKKTQLDKIHVRPQAAVNDERDSVSINFDKLDLVNLIEWIAKTFKITIFSGDIVNPLPSNSVAGKVAGAISFRTEPKLTKQQLWDLCQSFLEMSGLALVAQEWDMQGYPIIFQVMQSDASKNAPLPVFIGTPYTELPETETRIRYIYFVQNAPSDTINQLAAQLASKTALIGVYTPLRALIITDKAINIISIMKILTELDQNSMPEALSVLKLKLADAEDVVKLYNELVATEGSKQPGTTTPQLFGAKKASSMTYFPDNVRLIAERYTNSVIILGSQEGIKKVEQFIGKAFDSSITQPYSPLYVYELQYANAESIATILTAILQNFNANPTAASVGGVRDGDKYFKPGIKIQHEPTGNRLLIKAEKEDYLKIRELLRALDVRQPEIAIEALIINVSDSNDKQLGAQLRNKKSETLGANVDYQTSGLPGANQGIVVQQSDGNGVMAGSIMTNLIQLAAGMAPGSTLISLGTQATNGVWALFKMLESYTHANVISHPFLKTTNKFRAQVSVGETRRIVASQVLAANANTQAFNDLKANLTLSATPQINSAGIINLDVEIIIDEFTDPTDPSSATIESKRVKTQFSVADNQVIALGGLLRTTTRETITQVPLLGDLPLIGWFFKNKSKTKSKSNLLIFLCPRIITPELSGGIDPYTQNKLDYSREEIGQLHKPQEKRDPIHRWFFKDNKEHNLESLDDFANKTYHVDHQDVRKSTWYRNNTTPAPDERPAPKAPASQPCPQSELCQADKKPFEVAASKKRSLVQMLPAESKSPEGAAC